MCREPPRVARWQRGSRLQGGCCQALVAEEGEEGGGRSEPNRKPTNNWFPNLRAQSLPVRAPTPVRWRATSRSATRPLPNNSRREWRLEPYQTAGNKNAKFKSTDSASMWNRRWGFRNAKLELELEPIHTYIHTWTGFSSCPTRVTAPGSHSNVF